MISEDSIFKADPDDLRRLVRSGMEIDDPDAAENESATASIDGLLEQPGAQIGRYRLLRVLGEGGMGVVYLAQQDKPVTRQVALKVIKPGMDSKRVMARFEAEEQALALMEHPHVAHVHDAGLTGSGRPYFVMEYVKGIPITEHCDKHKLTIEERLRLFLHVCEAVQHAHQKGIIHRDLKPSNILVSFEGDKAVPKVIDFGVARAVSQRLTGKTFCTEQGQLIGTPEYMSPEQADLNNQDVDTRADIYSLGVVLYELLAGVLPFARETLRAAGRENMRKVICEEEPKTPSIRLSRTSSEESTESARQRSTSVRVLQRRLHGELDWITLKAMDKDRTRRYGSAGDLAADIRRHLSHEPVTAGPPGTAYRVKKFVRRNRKSVAATAAVLLVLIAGIVVSMLFALGQSRALAEAQAVSDFLRHSVLESLDSYRMGGKRITIRSVLDAASSSLEEHELARWPLAEADIRQTLGFAYWSLGLYGQAESHDKRALEIYRAHLTAGDISLQASIKNLGWVYYDQSRFEEARALFVEAVETALRVKDEEHWWDAPISMNMLANLYYIQGRFDEAEELSVKALEIANRHLGEGHGDSVSYMSTLASCYHLQGRYDEAEGLFNRALEISRRVRGDTDWHTLVMMRHFARLCWDLGRCDKAEQFLLQALDCGREAWDQEHPETLRTKVDLGWLRHKQGRYREAESLLAGTLEAARATLGEAHLCSLRSMHGLGTLYLSQGRYDEAEPLLEKALEIRNDLLGEENWYALRVANTLAKLYTAQSRYDDAERLFHETLKARTGKLREEHPETLETKNDLAVLRMRQARYDEAERLLLVAVQGRRLKLGDIHPHTLESWHNLIEIYEACNKPDEATKWRAKLPRVEDGEEQN